MGKAATLEVSSRNGHTPLDVEIPNRIHSLPIEFVTVGPNVRVNVAGIEELAASIAEHGVLQPIKVRHSADGAGYVVTWGQRRFLASQLAGRTEIPAIIDDTEQSPEARSIEQLIENLHRADLNPIDRARAMQRVVESGVRQVDLAKTLGIAPSTVANDLRLLETHAEVQAAVESGKLTPAHAKAIAGLDVDLQGDFAAKVLSSGWSAHETERQAKYAQDDAKRIRQRKVDAEKRAAEALEVLAKVAGKTKATIGVIDYAIGGDEVSKAISAAGYKTTSRGYDVTAVEQAGACGCAAWRVEIPYNASQKVTVKPGCINDEHRAARQAAERAKWEAERAIAQAARDVQEQAAKGRTIRVAEYLEGELAKQPTPFALRLAIAALVDDGPSELELDRYWNGEPDALNDLDDPLWTLLEAAPDEDLPKILARAIAEALDDWRGGEGVRKAIDAVLPAEAPEGPAVPNRKAKAAAATPA